MLFFFKKQDILMRGGLYLGVYYVISVREYL